MDWLIKSLPTTPNPFRNNYKSNCMRKKINWEIYSNLERNQIIETIKDLIDENDGCIINFNLFSDLALNLSIEIEEKEIASLYYALQEQLTISDWDTTIINPKSRREWLIFIHLSFNKGKGKTTLEIPNVPG